MIVKARKRFLSDLANIKSHSILEDIENAVDFSKQCSNPEEIPEFKWLTGYPGMARIKVENYRIGVEANAKTIIFKCALHRSVIYEQFP